MKYYHDAMIVTESFPNSVEKLQSEQPNKWQEEEECVSEAILFCGRQCIALRGDNEVLNDESRDNTGNFLAARQLTTKTFAWARKGVRPSH